MIGLANRNAISKYSNDFRSRLKGITDSSVPRLLWAYAVSGFPGVFQVFQARAEQLDHVIVVEGVEGLASIATVLH